MTDELLVKDMCQRLPYGTLCEVSYKDAEGYKKSIMKLEGYHHGSEFFFTTENGGSIYSNDFIPYLRQMSKMTHEEREEYMYLDCGFNRFIWQHTERLIDWLNEHHFDYRGLIDKGLALEATEGMYES